MTFKSLLIILFLWGPVHCFSQVDESILYHKALGLLQTERYKEALPLFDELVRMDSSNSVYRSNRAASYFNLKMYDAALKDYLILTKELPEESEFLFQAGNAYEHLDSLHLALSYYNKAIRIDKDNFMYFFKRGTILLKQEKLHEAIFDFTDAIALNPSHANSFHNRGIALYQTDKKVRACEDWCEASLLGNSTASLHLSRNCKTYPARCK
jgi:tetratricopeptide (TPR) repeat protein